MFMGLYTDLSTALAWIANQQPAEIALGLDRVKIVAERLQLLTPSCPVIIVGGTNGKGSTVAGLDAIYRAAGYQVGTFTSPILFRHNEYVHIDGQEVSDEIFCRAYEKIAESKGDVLLTPFEFHTLAALWVFSQKSLDVIILEVGLGGRLDAVNIIDADVSIVTSIDIDHADWLGDTREKIAFEKAGIFRANKPALCGDEKPPATLIEYAKKIGAELFLVGNDEADAAMRNKACVRKAVCLLQQKLPVTQSVIDETLQNLKVTGRVQILPGEVTKIFDVSHNPASVAYLAKRLDEMPCSGKTVAVFSMLADKDIVESVKKIVSQIDEWYIAPLNVKRGATGEQLLDALKVAGAEKIFPLNTIEDAYSTAEKKLKSGDRVVIFGSFHTVAELLKS